MLKVGIDGNRPLNNNGELAPQIDPTLLAQTGTRYVRVNFVLGPYASPDVGGWRDAYRRLIDGFEQAGILVYGLVGAEIMPNGHQDLFRTPADSPAADWIETYVARFHTITQFFGKRVVAYESVNEPNDWAGGSVAVFHASWFAKILARVYRVVKPTGVTLVSGPLFTHGDPEPGDDGIDYLIHTYQFGHQQAGWDQIRADFESSPLDGVGLHLYVCQGPDRDENAVKATFQDRLDRFAHAIDVLEGQPRSKPIYVSEFGWFSNLGGQDLEHLQARKIDAAFQVLLAHERVNLGSLFCMQDFQEQTRGLYRAGPLTNAARKPAFSRFQAIAASDGAGGPGMRMTHPQFIQGFAAFAAGHPEVGEPVEDQWYKESPGGRTFAFQTTTKGLLIWSQLQNEVRFAAF